MEKNFNNVKKVVDSTDANIPVNAEMDPVMADAYDDHVKASKHIQKVKKDLEDVAKNATKTTDPEFGKVPDNMYTKKLTLEEDVSAVKVDGRSNRTVEENDKDDYLDYDMFDFIYGMFVAETWPAPKNPLPTRIRKFRFTGDDDYLDTNTNKGTSQVGTEDGNSIVLYADTVADFDTTRQICDLYELEYEGPTPRRNPLNRWAFSFKIYVPMVNNDYPMMVEDYFESINKTLDDVMPPAWVKTYRKLTAKDNTRAAQELDAKTNAARVEKIYEKHRLRAANSNEPLRIFIADMFDEMESEGLKFKKSELKKRFEAFFEDDFEDDE